MFRIPTAITSEVDVAAAAIRSSVPLAELSNDGINDSSDEATTSECTDGGCSDENNQDILHVMCDSRSDNTQHRLDAAPSRFHDTRQDNGDVAHGCFPDTRQDDADFGDDEVSDDSADDEKSVDHDASEDSESEDDELSEDDDVFPQTHRCSKRRRWHNASEKLEHLRRLRTPAFLDWATLVYVHRNSQLQAPEFITSMSINSPASLLGPPVDLSRAISAPLKQGCAIPEPLARVDSQGEVPTCWVNQCARRLSVDVGSQSPQQPLAMQHCMLHEAARKRTSQWCTEKLLCNLAARNKLRHGDEQDRATRIDRSAVIEQAQAFDAFYAKVAQMDEASETKFCFLRPQRRHSMDQQELSQRLASA